MSILTNHRGTENTEERKEGERYREFFVFTAVGRQTLKRGKERNTS
jgi:hypothetical protein